MKTAELSVLPDLMRMHMERISCYEKEVSLLSQVDADLKMLFLAMIDQSRAMRNRIEKELQVLMRGNGAGLAGNIYRAWKNFRGCFTTHGRKKLVQECLIQEEAAIQMYRIAKNEYSLSHFISTLLNEQMVQLQSSILELEKFLPDKSHQAE